ncbi:MAG TPA: hypothetical protein VMS43_17310 [Allosphingosinicella sp.]|nr:hypothetical protein [Allosphingosinicella sp.]
MNEFDKNQNQGSETSEQGGKPAFGQFDKEQGEDRQTEKGEGRQEEFAGAGKAGQEQGGQEQSGQEQGGQGKQQPEFGQKGEEIDQGQQEQGKAYRQDDQQR